MEYLDGEYDNFKRDPTLGECEVVYWIQPAQERNE